MTAPVPDATPNATADVTPECPHGCGLLWWADDAWVCLECGDEWSPDDFTVCAARPTQTHVYGNTVVCVRTDVHTLHRNSIGAVWTDPCVFIAESGARSGTACGKQTRFTVAGHRVCGRHVGRAVELASRPEAPDVTVTPDSYDTNPGNPWETTP